jgi:hypothetical protein
MHSIQNKKFSNLAFQSCIVRISTYITELQARNTGKKHRQQHKILKRRDAVTELTLIHFNGKSVSLNVLECFTGGKKVVSLRHI